MGAGKSSAIAPAALITAADVAEEWRLQAARDLEVAERLVSLGYFEWAAYAAQQAAEKAIKAARHALAIDTHSNVKLSHKLIELATPIVSAYDSLLPGNEDLATITQHEADGRYPGVRKGIYQAPFKAYDKATADQAVVVARVIVERCSQVTSDLRAFWISRPVLPTALGTTARTPSLPPPSPASAAGTSAATAASAEARRDAADEEAPGSRSDLQPDNAAIAAAEVAGE